MGVAEAGAETVERFLEPLADAEFPSGPNLEYDNAFLELNQAAAGKAETQFAAGSPPDWRAVREGAEALLERSRDLRIAALWARAAVCTHGFAALPQGLRLLHGLLDRFWDSLYPLPDPDDNDPFERVSVLASLPQTDGLLGDVRAASLTTVRGIGDVKVRIVEAALGLAAAREGDPALTREQAAALLADAAVQDPSFAALPASALSWLEALKALVDEKAGAGAVDFKPLHQLLRAIANAMPSGEPAAVDEPPAPGVAAAAAPTAALTGVRSREEAVRAIDMVCEFLERTEPTSPAPLLLRRARTLVDRNFLQLMKELAPDALPEVARLMGVDPDTVNLGP